MNVETFMFVSNTGTKNHPAIVSIKRNFLKRSEEYKHFPVWLIQI